MNIDPKHLVQLSMIVEAGSFQAAADRLKLTQPALSRNMQTLETRLDSTLFQRDGRKSVPNALGQRLARNGLAIRAAEEQAIMSASRYASGSEGELKIGAPPIVAGRFLTDALSEFIRTNPSCSVELRTGLVHELRAMLERGQIDIVLGPQSLADPNLALEFNRLIDDRVGILCRSGHELTLRRRVRAVDLEKQIWVAHSKGSLLRQQTEAAMIAFGVTDVHVGLETDSIRSVLEVVAQTDLITSMPRITTKPYLAKTLEFLQFDHPQFKRPLGCIRRKDTPASGVEKRFLKSLTALIQ